MIEVGAAQVPGLIDELPLLALVVGFAAGTGFGLVVLSDDGGAVDEVSSSGGEPRDAGTERDPQRDAASTDDDDPGDVVPVRFLRDGRTWEANVELGELK